MGVYYIILRKKTIANPFLRIRLPTKSLEFWQTSTFFLFFNEKIFGVLCSLMVLVVVDKVDLDFYLYHNLSHPGRIFVMYCKIYKECQKN